MFNLDYHPAEDCELWKKILLHYEIANIPEILTHYRLHSSSQEFDTTPLSILMAFGCEIPVITTDREDFRGVVENGRDAALVPVGDHEQIGKMLIRLQQDKKLRQDLAQHAQNVWKIHFCFDRMVKKTWDILLQSKKRPLEND